MHCVVTDGLPFHRPGPENGGMSDETPERPFRFSLRTLLVVTTLFTVGAASCFRYSMP